MQTGDPKKVAILSVVAVLIVGIAVFQAIPKGDKPLRGKAATVQAKTAAHDETQSGLHDSSPTASLALQQDAFAHPGLERKEAKSEADPAPTASKGAGSQPPFDPMQGSIGPAGPEPLPGVGGTPAPDPAGNTGINQQSDQASKTTLKLEAIVTVTEPRAFIALDGGEAKAYVEGNSLGGLGKVIKISENSVTIQIGQRKLKLAVGAEELLK